MPTFVDINLTFTLTMLKQTTTTRTLRQLFTIICLALGSAIIIGCANGDADRHHKLRQSIEDSIKLGHTSFASRCINEQMAAAKDSDTYYLWLTLRNKMFYISMQTDSMNVTMNRIQRYIDKCNNRKDKNTGDTFRQLYAEWLLAKGVCQSAFMGRPDSALIYNSKAIEQLQKSRTRPELMLIALTNQADFYRQTGRLDYSANTYMQALALADSMNNINATIAVELGIAIVYSHMADYENSKRWWERLELHLPQMQKADRFIFYNDRGNDFYLQQRYSEALPYFEKAAALIEEDTASNMWNYHTALANLGMINACLGRNKQAEQALDAAERFFKEVGFDIGLYYITTSRITVDLHNGHIDKALQRIGKAPTPDYMLPTAVVQRLNTEELVYRAAKMMPQAYEAHRRKDTINDSINTAQMNMRMNANLLQYKHDRQLAEQQHIIDRQHIMELLGWGLFLISTLIIIVLATLVYLRRRQQQLRDLKVRQEIVKLRMENIRNRISPHFVFNALNHEMLAQMNGKSVNLNALTQLLRRGLAQAEVLVTTLSEEMKFINYYVSIEGQQMGADFHYETDIDKEVDTEHVSLPAMVVQIFVENAIKHGLRPKQPVEGKHRKLTVRIRRNGNDATEIEVLDNGLGLGAPSTGRVHTGMKVVRQTIQILNDQNTSKITFGVANRRDMTDGQTGCRSWITIPDNFDFTI